jgi:hypothetical protein
MEDRLDEIGNAMRKAWSRVKNAQSKLWSEWMIIGEGLLEGRRWAMAQAGVNKPEGKGYVVAMGEWLVRYKVDDMDKGDRAKLLQLMEERPAVEEWRASLTDHERRNLNNPVVIWRKWTAMTRVRKPRPHPTSSKEMARAQRTIDQLQARNEELQEEVANGSDETLQQEVAALRARVAELELENARLKGDVTPEQLVVDRILTAVGWRFLSPKLRTDVERTKGRARPDLLARVLEEVEDLEEEGKECGLVDNNYLDAKLRADAHALVDD